MINVVKEYVGHDKDGITFEYIKRRPARRVTLFGEGQAEQTV